MITRSVHGTPAATDPAGSGVRIDVPDQASGNWLSNIL